MNVERMLSESRKIEHAKERRPVWRRRYVFLRASPEQEAELAALLARDAPPSPATQRPCFDGIGGGRVYQTVFVVVGKNSVSCALTVGASSV